ncbi:hypothetical protein AB5I39_09560 [Sphingomonas sp. MMS24-J45]|uniref:hypothetical protein n=1 Tax=Sphingomonas sp. MMS24-J45 TaxID=3238806 RepID=UPI00384B5261
MTMEATEIETLVTMLMRRAMAAQAKHAGRRRHRLGRRHVIGAVRRHSPTPGS